MNYFHTSEWTAVYRARKNGTLLLGAAALATACGSSETGRGTDAAAPRDAVVEQDVHRPADARSMADRVADVRSVIDGGREASALHDSAVDASLPHDASVDAPVSDAPRETGEAEAAAPLDAAVSEAGDAAAACTSAQYDTCLDALTISGPGAYLIDTTCDHFDYPTSCGLGATPSARDAVAAILLPAGPPVDVTVTAHTSGTAVSVAVAGQCSDPSAELACGATFVSPSGGGVARARARGVGSASQATAYPVYLETATGAATTLDVTIVPAAPMPTNVTCGTASPLAPGVLVDVDLIDAPANVPSMCTSSMGQLVYAFTLATTSDVDLLATSKDGTGLPIVSLRDPGCALLSDETACTTGAPAHLVQHALEAGTYYVSVSSSAPTDMSLLLTITGS